MTAKQRCRKLRHRDRIGALFALARTQRQDRSYRLKSERRAYRCPDCKGWHLTSLN